MGIGAISELSGLCVAIDPPSNLTEGFVNQKNVT
jgi:hypothetical protein